ncbi:cysteine desulfurase family protein [Ruegeria sp. HKCCA5929]|uniref:cysteine desulfurase family protein n=1 Tax=Ruegeria sp. HKCCA5929 TaxID=2682988 RepID=UPI0014889644|nr:cysteine desulfurase family protein [Ruegeria sp. HKCCA5929]
MKNVKSYYLDYQATTPLDLEVLEQMSPYFAESFGNPHSADHARGWKAAQSVELAALRIAALIGADTDEIIFTSGATEANNLALLGLARRASSGKRRRILLSAIEHKCVLATGRAIQKELGFQIETLKVDAMGRVDLEHFAELIGDDVLAVSVMAVNNEIGTIQDIETVGKIAHSYGTIFHCDGAQAPCAMDISELAEHADMVSLSGHKMYGPMGVGALYIRRDLQSDIEPLIYGGGQQNNLRSGTLPTPLCVGMGGAAALLNRDNARSERARLSQLRDRFVQNLMALPYPIALNGPPLGEMRHPGNANIRFDGFSAQDILSATQPQLVASSGAACTSGIPEPSHVLRAIGLKNDEADASIRFSLGRGTCEEDVDEAVSLIEGALSNFENKHMMHFA